MRQKENNELILIIDLKDKIKKMSKKEIENEKPDKILEIVEEILKYKETKQQGLGLKILTPNQMLSKLPIILAQLKAGIIQKNLKMKLGKFYIICTDQKNLQLCKSLIDIIQKWTQSL